QRSVGKLTRHGFVDGTMLPVQPMRSLVFPATRWSLVGRAATRGTENGKLALAELVQIYLPALRAFLTVSMRIDEHRADDLLQGFLADRVLQQDMIAQADRERGKFRTFLLATLKRYAID